jgi:hypothetical protein
MTNGCNAFNATSRTFLRINADLSPLRLSTRSGVIGRFAVADEQFSAAKASLRQEIRHKTRCIAAFA